MEMFLLLSLLAVLVGFDVWRRVPRRLMFDILHIATWIYVLCFLIGLQVMDRTAPRIVEGFVPYVLPVPLVALFVAWARHRQKKS
jgi:hypothetical protein